MAVCTDQSIRVGHLLAMLVNVGPNGLRQILKVHLMTNTSSWRHNPEVVKGGLAPLQEGVTFHVTLIFAVDIHLKCARRAEFINHDRVVDDQIDRVKWINFFRITTQSHNTISHSSQINYSGHSCEILHQYTCRTVSNLTRIFSTLYSPFGEGFYVVD